MLDELINLTLSIDFEEYGALDLQGAICDPSDYDADDYSGEEEWGVLIRLSLNLDTGAESDAKQSWEVDCVGVLEHQISLGRYDGLNLYNDHVLLWDHNSPKASVSFYGEARDPLAVVIALMNSHSDLTDDWLPFGRFMNGNPLEMIAGRYGVLAEGPLLLMESYAKVLESFGIGTGIANHHVGEFTGLPKLEVLILERNCYVVASKFNAHRVA